MLKTIISSIIAVLIIFLLTAFSFGETIPIQEYTKAIEQSSEENKYKFYAYRGRAYFAEGNYDNAIKDFNQSIYLNPTLKVYYMRGKAYFAIKEYVKSITDFNLFFLPK